MASANEGAGDISVFRNTSTIGITSSSFSPKVDFATGNSPQFVTIADLNGDGISEMAAASNPSLVSIFQIAQPAAPPTITTFIPAQGPVGTSVTITGTNFNATAANNTVFFGAVRATVNSGTTTTLNVTVPAGVTYQPISVLDNATALTGYSSRPFITTFANPFGAGVPDNFYKPKVDFQAGDAPFSTAIGDVDGDGKPDLVVANSSSNTISVLRNISSSENVSSATFAAKVDFATDANPYTVAIGDLDGDGKPDVAVGYLNAANVSVFHNTAIAGSITASSLAQKVDFATGVRAISVAIGDVDGDGKPELMSSNYESNTVSVLQNTTTAGSINSSSFATKIDFNTGINPVWVAIGDLDGDGKPELAVANDNSNGISLFHNTSVKGSITPSSFSAKVDYSTGERASTVVIGDLNEDGKPDLAVANVTANNVTVLQNL